MGCCALVLTCSAIAVTASRTFAKVKSSAMRPRQPDVPNLMGEVAMWRYSRPRELESRKFGDGPGRGNCGKCAGRRAMRKGGQGRIVAVTCGTLPEGRPYA